MGLAGLLGGTVGAVVLLNTPQTTFMHLVPWLLLGAALDLCRQRAGLALRLSA